MEWLSALKDYVPLFQTLFWVLLIIIGISIYSHPLNNILEDIHKRMEKGGALKAGIGSALIDIPEFARDLPKVEPADNRLTDVEERKSIPSWTEKRHEIIENNREVFLTHISKPSKTQGRSDQQWFDVYIFLARHHKVANAEIDYAEFFLGKSWDNRIFKVKNMGGDIKNIGISTSAYGTTLAICHVVFKDGHQVVIDRYIDFEMGKEVFQNVNAK